MGAENAVAQGPVAIYNYITFNESLNVYNILYVYNILVSYYFLPLFPNGHSIVLLRADLIVFLLRPAGNLQDDLVRKFLTDVLSEMIFLVVLSF